MTVTRSGEATVRAIIPSERMSSGRLYLYQNFSGIWVTTMKPPRAMTNHTACFSPGEESVQPVIDAMTTTPKVERISGRIHSPKTLPLYCSYVSKRATGIELG